MKNLTWRWHLRDLKTLPKKERMWQLHDPWRWGIIHCSYHPKVMLQLKGIMNCIYEKPWASRTKESKEKKKIKGENLSWSLFSFVFYRTQSKEYVHTEFPHPSLFQALPISKRSWEGISVTPPKCSLLGSEDVNLREETWRRAACESYRSSFTGQVKCRILHAQV